MFDLEKPHHLHEAGARWGWGIDVSRPQPLKILPLKHNLYMQSSCGLNALLLDEPADYGAFWFFAFPVAMPREHGLCLPFFVVGDDIEFGLRFTRAFGGRIAPLAGVAVWHVPFYFKLDSLAPYFFLRNLLVISAVHDAYRPWTMAARFVFEIFKALCLFDYLRAFKMIRGVEDFLRSPSVLPDIGPQSVLAACEELRTRYGLRPVPALPDATARPFDTEPAGGCFRECLRWLTLGGHLLPAFLLRRAPALTMTHRCGQWRLSFGHDRIHNLHCELQSCGEQTLRHSLGLSLFLRAFRFALGLAWSWRDLCRRWRDAAPAYTSQDYWRGRLDRPNREAP
jgi:galactofuranosylgalactofuranosylrhamnosyl-N-acetylglucosaminyl-diphospho-decaprenol beta-1,5/1,6-galactofuranosyltransferase